MTLRVAVTASAASVASAACVIFAFLILTVLIGLGLVLDERVKGALLEEDRDSSPLPDAHAISRVIHQRRQTCAAGSSFADVALATIGLYCCSIPSTSWFGLVSICGLVADEHRFVGHLRRDPRARVAGDLLEARESGHRHIG